MTARRSTCLLTVLGFGFAFLYLPIALLIVYSFNESRLSRCGRASRRIGTSSSSKRPHPRRRLAEPPGRGDQRHDRDGARRLRRPSRSARFGRFRGRTPFAGLVTAPLVMPEVLIGLSLLLFFVASGQVIGWPGQRGFTTIVIAHATFGTAFVAVVVQARVRLLDPSLEEAALDLGAPPLRTFLAVTLPLIAPALAAGWLLAFTLSLDDLVIASFVTGPGATTLPMVVFSSVRLGVSPQINALATLFVLAAAILVTTASWFLRRQERLGAQP